MPADNRISLTIPPATTASVIAKLGEIRTLLEPFAVNLTPQERQRTPTLGTERGAMVQTFDTQMASHPTLVPNYVDMAEKAKDSAAWTQALSMAQPAKEVVEILSDILTLIGADLLTAYLAFYGSVKGAAKHNVPGSTTVLQDLARFFARGSNTPATPPNP